MVSADVRLPQRIVLGADADHPCRGVDLNRCLRRAGNGQMSGGAEERFNLDHSAVDVDAVQEPPGEGDRYGRKYAQNAERYGEFDQGECIPHRSFRRIARLDSI